MRSAPAGLATVAALAALVSGGCGSPRHEATWGGRIAQVEVRVDDSGCSVEPARFPAGGVSFAITNDGSAPAEVRVAMEGIGQLADNAGIDPGRTSITSLNLVPGRYAVECGARSVAVEAEGDWSTTGPYEHRGASSD